MTGDLFICSLFQHTPIDGLVSGTLAGVGVLEAAKDKTDLDEAKKDLMASEVKFEVEELSFEFREKRDHFKSLLANTQRRVERKKSDLRIELKKVVAFGKSDLKEVGIHPDTFVQIALQIASYLTHSRQALPTFVSSNIVKMISFEGRFRRMKPLPPARFTTEGQKR